MSNLFPTQPDEKNKMPEGLFSFKEGEVGLVQRKKKGSLVYPNSQFLFAFLYNSSNAYKNQKIMIIFYIEIQISTQFVNPKIIYKLQQYVEWHNITYLTQIQP